MHLRMRSTYSIWHVARTCATQVVDAADMLYLVMEHAPNPSLLDYVRSRKRLSEGKAAIILKQIVAGLQYCHSREVVHRCVQAATAGRPPQQDGCAQECVRRGRSAGWVHTGF